MTSESTSGPEVMSPKIVDAKLEELRGVVDICIAQWRIEDQDALEVSEVEESELEPGPESGWPDPDYALKYAQWRLSSDRVSGRSEMARDFAAWWADAATVALLAAVTGTGGVDPVRFDAGNPSRRMADEELGNLSGTTDDGGYVVIEAGDPVRRREQLWGDDWAEHQVPRLPSSDELMDWLTGAGLRADRVGDVGQAREAVAEALASRKQALAGATKNEEALWDRADQLTELLAEYANLVTRLLPIIRSNATGEPPPP